MRLAESLEAAFVDPAGVPGEGHGVADFENLNVGKRIKAMRQQRGWSAERVAKESAHPLDRTAIWKVENGKRRLKFEEAVALANVFGVPLADLTDSGQGPVAPGSTRDTIVAPGRPAAEPAASLPVGWFRRAELDTLVNRLTSGRGPHFWLVTAPPGFGKTVLLSDLCAELKQKHGWAANMVDVRLLTAGLRDKPESLLAGLIGVGLPNELSDERTGAGTATRDASGAYRAAAQHISKEGKPLLCALDSAELLSPNSIQSLREALSSVSGSLEETANPEVRLAFVVASRLDDGWRGVIPQPKLSVLPFPEFDMDTVEKRLREAAGAREQKISPDKFRCTAALVQRLTAGVPELLQPALDWVEREQWIDLYRLGHPDVFESVAAGFVGRRLLATDSLLPQGGPLSEARQAVVLEAIRPLTRYRFFTKANVRHHVESDEALRQAFDQDEGGFEDLWSAVSGTALLARPLPEPWQAFHPAVRSLLFRYFYPTDEERARAHQEASRFIAEWVDRQSGTDQVAGLIERLWHDAEVLRWQRADHQAAELRDIVRQLREAVRQTEAYSATELRSYAADLIVTDGELRESIGGSDELAVELANLMVAER